MTLNPGQAEEYIRRHHPIWPELAAVQKENGVHNYSIFFHPETRQLFAYVEIEDEARWVAVGRTAVGQRWRKHMSDILATHPDFTPVTAALSEVFHLD